MGRFFMRLIIIRYGETEANVGGFLAGHSETLLTDRGFEQAKEIGRLLRNMN